MQKNLYVLTLLLATVAFTSLAQSPHLEVEGHVKIRGNIDIHSQLDSTVILIGKDAGKDMAFGGGEIHSTYVGNKAGKSNTDGFNSFFGSQAGMNSSGDQNSFFGARAGENNGGGFSNSFFGVLAGFNNSDVANNSFFGAFAGRSNEHGSSNSFFGARAGEQNVDTDHNSFFGSETGMNNLGESNSFFGSHTGFNNITGQFNSFFGFEAGGVNTSGADNTFLGSQSGLSNYVGSKNTFVGSRTDVVSFEDTLDRAIAIGYNAEVGCSNCAVIGGTGEDSINLGIGTTLPVHRLDVRGHTQIRGRLDINHMEDTTSVFIGRNAGANMNFQFQHHNTIVGSNAGRHNASSSDNSFFGSEAGRNTQAEGNSFFGSLAGLNNSSGYENAFFGYESGKENGSGHRNAYFGFHAGLNYTSASNNTFIGQSSGTNGSGSSNTFVGALSGLDSGIDSLDHAIAIGKGAKVGCSNCAVIGGTGANSVKVGIGISEPTKELDVNGNAKFRGVPDLPPFNTAFQLYIESDGTLYKAAGISSDQRLKENIKPLNSALDKINKIGGYRYNFKDDPTHREEIGVIAQEIEAVFPELVFTKSTYKSVDYQRLSVVLLQAIKEQQQQIELLQAKVQVLEDQN